MKGVPWGLGSSLGPGCQPRVKGRRICPDLTDTFALSQSWPITGGRNLAQEPSQRGLLLTG